MFRNIVNLLISDRVVRVFVRLYPKWEFGKRLYDYYIQKFKLSVLVVIIGLLLSILVYFSNGTKLIDEEYRIKRNGYEGGDKNTSIDICTKNGTYKENIDIVVSEKRYSDYEINNLSDECVDELYNIILSTNPSYDYVTEDLKFIRKLDAYPFDISYMSSRPLILSSDGSIDLNRINEKDDISSGIDVQITMTISYHEYRREEIFNVCIFEKELSQYERLDNDIREAIKDSNNNTISDDYLYLPLQVDGEYIVYTEKENHTYMFVIIISVFTSILIFIFKDMELEKELTNRDKELEKQYPKLINKFVLFYNAGIPIKTIWMILCDDYVLERNITGKKKYLYEEMLITKSQISDGKSEVNAYEEFAKRINLPKYRLFISLIEQAVTMGRRDLDLALRKECDTAFIERKNNAKKLFEEASTKLLMPMFMMLIVVIVILMFPAFYSFKM